MWYLYQMTVKNQKNEYPKVTEVGEQSLPFHAEASLAQSTLGLNYYLEARFLLQNYREWVIQLVNRRSSVRGDWVWGCEVVVGIVIYFSYGAGVVDGGATAVTLMTDLLNQLVMIIL